MRAGLSVGLLWALVVVALLAPSASRAAPSETASAARTCKFTFYYPPTGYAIAIYFVRVSGVSCATARRVGRTQTRTGHGPKGWRCEPHPRGTRCVHRGAKVIFHVESAS